MKNVIILLLTLTSFVVNGAVITWVGGTSNNWTDGANWDLGVVPTPIDDVVIGYSSPAPRTTVTAPSGTTDVKSITLQNTVFNTVSGSILNVSGNSGLLSSFYLDNTNINNLGIIDIVGGLLAVQSLIINPGGFRMHGSGDNSPVSFELTNSSSMYNTTPVSFLDFLNNVESGTGFHKDILLKINNSSILENDGYITSIYNFSLQDWVNVGIEIDNNSSLRSISSGVMSIQGIRINGIHVKNTSGAAPKSKFINHGYLQLDKCTTCNYGEFICGIKVDENAMYEDFPVTSTTIIQGFTGVNDSDVCVSGTIGSYGSLGGPAVDMGNYSFDPTAVLQGTGVVIIDDGMSSSFNATVRPGGPMVGELEVQGNFTSSSSTVFQMKIEGMGEPGMMMGHDQIEWGTDETTLSMSTLQVELSGGFAPNVGDQFQIFTGTVEGEFENLNLPGGNDSWQVNYDPNGVMIEVIAPINNINNAGIGTLNPRTKLEINGGDILLSSIGTGVVLTSPGGLYFKITVDDNGAIQSELIPCPEVWECP